MASRNKFWLSALAAAGLLLSGSPAKAQGPADYPHLRGNNQGTGRNGDPLTNSSGRTRLRWFSPFGFGNTQIITLDNTDFPDLTTPPTNIYDQNLGTTEAYGPTIGTPNRALWPGPELDKEGSDVRRVAIRYSVPTNFAPREPGYVYSRATPAARGNDPTIAQDPTKRTTFEWTITPADNVQRYYALYVWLPSGTTDISAAGGLVDRHFTQRYFVYEVISGTGQRQVEVIDSYSVGSGFVRLGTNGGANPNSVYPYDGVNPLKIRLYNTMPRRDDGGLTMDRAGRVFPNSAAGRAAEQTIAQDYLVYADSAQAVPTIGNFIASPTSAGFGGTVDASPSGFRVTSALNETTSSFRDGVFTTILKGVVTSYEGNPALWTKQFQVGPPPVGGEPTPVWRYSPAEESDDFSTTLDVNSITGGNSVGTTLTALWTDGTTNPRHQGTSYVVTPIDTAGVSQTATYTPDLADGTYEIYAYVGANETPELYGRAVQYTIFEGATAVFTGTLDQSGPNGPGWVKLGVRRYTQDLVSATASKLSVVLTNFSTNPLDAGRVAYADAVRFVGASNLSISSTPVHAEVNLKKRDGSIALTKVVVIADENGRIHCVDAAGNADGTTTEYWSYPSTPDPNNANWVDPNLVSGVDGVVNPNIQPPRDNRPIAEMPTGFDISTALIQRINGQDYLFIGGKNGRIYCIDMTGTGQYDDTVLPRKVGYTSRVWTYPNDYPAAIPTKTNVGAIRGSLVYADAAEGASGPTVLVPAGEGRMYALNALGNAATHTTSTRWTFPNPSQTTLPPIVMSPSVEFGKVFFGTQRNPRNDAAGTFYALNIVNGQVVWAFNGIQNLPQRPSGVTEDVGDWVTGPVTVPATELAKGDPAAYIRKASENSVYALNSNLYLYGFNADTGEILSGATGNLYRTSELGAVSIANLGFTFMTVFDRNGSLARFPIITASTTSGFMAGMFARVDDYNIFTDLGAGGATGLQAFGFTTRGEGVTTPAFSNSWMYLHDTAGYLYAFDDDTFGTGFLVDGYAPGYEQVTPNNPVGKPFRVAKVKLMNKLGYNRLKQVNADGTGGLTYAQATTDPTYSAENPPPGKPFAFEWGQTAYIMVYDLPFATIDQAGNQIAPPVVEIRLSVDGAATRSLFVDTRQFSNPATAPILNDPISGAPLLDGAGNPYRADGYGAVAFTFQNGGTSSLPPGNGQVTVRVRTAATNSSGVVQDVVTDTRPGATNANRFVMANPLAIQVIDPYVAGSTAAPAFYGIGYTTSPYDDGNLVNGSPDIGSTSAIESQLLSSAGFAQHGQTQTSRVYLYDRSLMTLIRPDPALTNIRVDRSSLLWQGGSASIYRPLDNTLYPNFEDRPDQFFPNRSLDYPDIAREQIRFTKDPNGNAENPALTNVGLTPPTDASGNPITEDTVNLAGRVLRPTPMDIAIDVPKYQPGPDTRNLLASLGLIDDADDFLRVKHDSAGNVEPQGFFGRVRVFVDSTNDGQLNLNQREAYRAFNLAVGVAPDIKVAVATPTVDLGSLASGSGYPLQQPGLTPGSDVTTSGAFNPWNGQWATMFKPFRAQNDGNVNILDLRLAKATAWQQDVNGNIVAGPLSPWGIFAPANDTQVWLDATFDLWSNIDTWFAPPNPNGLSGGGNRVILPKPRVTDRVANELVVNPWPRANANTGATGDTTARLNTTLNSSGGLLYSTPQNRPEVAVSIPIGTPVGTYTQTLRLVEDYHDNAINSNGIWEPYPIGSNSVEPFSDPSLSVTFNVRESRLTNSSTRLTSNMVDNGTDLLPNGQPAKFTFANMSPAGMRDAFGSLVVAWSSNRLDGTGNPNFVPTNPGGLAQNDQYRIYLATLDSGATFNAGDFTTPKGTSPLRDLNYWNPAGNGRWFRQAVGPFPTTPVTTLFPGGTPIVGTDRFGLPAFPVNGQVDPLNPNNRFSSSYMAFVGDVQKQTGTGRLVESKVFTSTATTDANGVVTMSTPEPFRDDVQTTKGKPSVLQLTTGALVFYDVTAAGKTDIQVTRVGGNGPTLPTTLDFGSGFSSVSSPSVTARPYTGGLSAAFANLADITFAGKLRGRPNAEIYMSRVRLATPKATDAQHDPLDTGSYEASALHMVDQAGYSLEVRNSGSPFVYMPAQANERLTAEGNGLYRARGVEWDRTQPISLVQFVNGAPVSLIVDASRAVDRQSGLISYDSRIGGKVYFDPSLGTVRFTAGTLAQGAEIRLNYTPAFVRVAGGGVAGYSGPTAMYDHRYISDYLGWFAGNSSNSAGPTSQLTNDRFLFTFGRGASGNGQTARPYMTSMRFGVRLPYRVATAENGAITLSVANNRRPFQVDPGNGRVYFEAEDEDVPVTITYKYVIGDDSTGASVGTMTITSTVGLIGERGEEPVAIDQAVNESQLTSFLDPFSYPSDNTNRRERPPLVWMFYSSTRAGAPDIYFQTIAPRYGPFVTNK